MFNKLLMTIIGLIVVSLFSCNDSTLDPDKNNDSNSKYVFYTKILNDKYQARRINLETMEDTLILDFKDKYWRLLGVVGNKLYYGGIDYSVSTHYIKRCDPDGKNVTIMSSWNISNYAFLNPIISPNGSKLLYFSYGTNNKYYCCNIDGTNINLVFTRQPDKYDLNIGFSCDSKSIGILEQTDSLVFKLYTCNSDGTNLKYINEYSGFGNMIGTWSQGGNNFAFTSVDTSSGYKYNIALLNLQSMNVKKITSDDMSGYNMAWSPDEKKIVFYHETGKIFVINSDGTNKVQIPNTPTNSLYKREFQLYPKFSADSKQVLFQTSTKNWGWGYIYGDLRLLNLNTMQVKTLVSEDSVLNAFFM